MPVLPCMHPVEIKRRRLQGANRRAARSGLDLAADCCRPLGRTLQDLMVGHDLEHVDDLCQPLEALAEHAFDGIVVVGAPERQGIEHQADVRRYGLGRLAYAGNHVDNHAAFPVDPFRPGIVCDPASGRGRLERGQAYPRRRLELPQRRGIVAVVGKVRRRVLRHPQLPEAGPAHEAQVDAVGLERAHRCLDAGNLGRDMRGARRRDADVPVLLLHRPAVPIDGAERWIGGERIGIEEHQAARDVEDAPVGERVAKAAVIVAGIALCKLRRHRALDGTVGHGQEPALGDHEGNAPLRQQRRCLVVAEAEAKIPIVVVNLHAERKGGIATCVAPGAHACPPPPVHHSPWNCPTLAAVILGIGMMLRLFAGALPFARSSASARPSSESAVGD